ncbi:MAG TPA: aspartate aminotransferase family protein [Verrucomicrobia bacterium]|nr:MAG: acetylornithine aminotransferase [Lentisphaerae bacterium GWF2_57_35]HBA84029.1 aspartate aminotransferase family protein [Verrucomicrobiota bacterium]
MTDKDEVLELYKKYVMTTYAPELLLVRGRDAKVTDADGKDYLDFLSGISVLNVGHGHPKVVHAIARQANKLMHVSNLYFNEMQPRLAKALSDRSLGGKCFFCNSGAEANEGMFKLARLWGSEQGKYEIVTMRNSFHGRTLATMTATGQTKYQKGFAPLMPGFVYADFNDLNSVRNVVADKTVAVLVEAVQGEGGIIPATQEFMTGLRALCDEKKILMLCDEVQCGMGRTGRWFGYQHYGVQPDAFSLAKALGGGFPIGALVAAPKLSEVFKPGNHASTFGGNPLACAAALAAIEAMEEEEMLHNAVHMGKIFMDGLSSLSAKYGAIEQVRGLGLMVGLVCNKPTKPLERIMREKGLIALATGESVMRFLPPLNVKEVQVRKALQLMDESMAVWADSQKK